MILSSNGTHLYHRRSRLSLPTLTSLRTSSLRRTNLSSSHAMVRQQRKILVLLTENSGAGIWDVLSNQQVVDWIRRAIAERKPLQDIAEQMLDRCLAPDSDWGGVGCDNMTILIVGILGGKTKDEWYDTIAKRVELAEGYPTPSVQQDPFSTGPRAAAALPPSGQIKADGLPPNLVAALKATGLLKEDSTEAVGSAEEGEDSEDVEMAPPGTDTPEQIQDAAKTVP